jgi:hypothetical protein
MTIRATHASPHKGRLLLAIGLMPVVNTLLAFVVFPTVRILRERAEFQVVVGTDHGSYVLAVLTGVVAVMVTVAGAVPVFYSLVKRGPVSLKQTLLAGLALGNAPFVVITLFTIMFALMHVAAGTISEHLAPLPDLIAGNLFLIAVGSFFGVASAAVFWTVAILGTEVSTSTPTDAGR